MLLNQQYGCQMYDDLRTVSNVVYPSFKDACSALGLLDDDKESIAGINECSELASGYKVRKEAFIMSRHVPFAFLS